MFANTWMSDAQSVEFAARLEEIRTRGSIREEWLTSIRGTNHPFITILDLLEAVNVLQGEVEILRREMEQVHTRIDAVDGGSPMSKESW